MQLAQHLQGCLRDAVACLLLLCCTCCCSHWLPRQLGVIGEPAPNTHMPNPRRGMRTEQAAQRMGRQAALRAGGSKASSVREACNSLYLVWPLAAGGRRRTPFP